MGWGLSNMVVEENPLLGSTFLHYGQRPVISLASIRVVRRRIPIRLLWALGVTLLWKPNQAPLKLTHSQIPPKQFSYNPFFIGRVMRGSRQKGLETKWSVCKLINRSLKRSCCPVHCNFKVILGHVLYKKETSQSLMFYRSTVLSELKSQILWRLTPRFVKQSRLNVSICMCWCNSSTHTRLNLIIAH